MDKNYFIELTINLYRVTDIFLNEEPLKFILRKKADQILEKLSPYHFSEGTTMGREEALQLKKEIQSLQSLLRVAEACEESDQLSFFLLAEEYKRVEEELERIISPYLTSEKENEEELEKEDAESDFSLSGRQQKILGFLKHQPNLKTDELARKFSGVTTRTIRRDLGVLLEKGLIQRKKIGKTSFYRIKLVDKT